MRERRSPNRLRRLHRMLLAHRHRRHHARNGRSLGKRLLRTYVCASLLSLLMAFGGFQALLTWRAPDIVAHLLSDQGDWIQARLRFDAGGGAGAVQLSASGMWVYDAVPLDLAFRVLDAHGGVLLSSVGPAREDARRPLAPAGAGFDGLRSAFDVVRDGVLLHVQTRAVQHAGAAFYVQTAVSQRALELVRHAVVWPMIKNGVWVALITAGVFAIGMHFTLGRMLKPLRDASDAASRIEPRALGARLATASMPREMRPLTMALNAALDRIEKGYRVQQDFLAAAAHELKTPLALMRGQVELSDTADRDHLLRDIDMMARQVHQLLHLAEVSELNNYAFEQVDIALVAAEVAYFLQRLAQRATVHIDLRAGAGTAVRRADRGALFVLLKNLVENAIQHSPRGAVVSVHVDEAGIVVRDEGPGIPAQHLAQVFARFWRGPGRRDSGAGLGLAICQEIALAHGWTLAVDNAETGAAFRISFAALG